MSSLRTTTAGATTAASACFSSAIGVLNPNPNLAIRVGAAASTFIRCNGAGGKTRHAARGPHVRFGSKADLVILTYEVRFTLDSGHLSGVLRTARCAAS
jgi:hypothetical protein